MAGLNIGDIELPSVQNVEPEQEKEVSEFKALGLDDPIAVEHEPDLESLSIEGTLVKMLHSERLDIEQQREVLKALVRRSAGENAIDYLDWTGHLSVEEVDAPSDGTTANAQSVSISATYLPHSGYVSGVKTHNDRLNNEYGIARPGAFALPSAAENVKVRNPETDDVVPLDPVATESTDSGTLDVYNLWLDTETNAFGGSTEVFFPGFSHSTGVELNGSNERALVNLDLPQGEYRLVARIHSNGSDTAEFGVWNEPEAQFHFEEDIDVEDGTESYTSSSFTITDDLGYNYRVLASSETQQATVDTVYPEPQFTPEILFDLPTGDYPTETDVWFPLDGTLESVGRKSPTVTEATGYDLRDGYIDFDGTGSIGYDPSFLDDDFSMQGTIYVEARADWESMSGGSVRMFSTETDGGDWRTWKSGGDIRFYMGIDGSEPNVDISRSYSDGEWMTFFAQYRYNPESDTTFIRGGSDGEVVESHTADGAPDYPFDVFALGRWGSKKFPGDLRNVRVDGEFHDIDTIRSFGDASTEDDVIQAIQTPQRMGAVAVYDDMQSSDRSDWERVRNIEHSFEGGIVIDNGIVTHRIDEPQGPDVELPMRMWLTDDPNTVWSIASYFGRLDSFELIDFSAASAVVRIRGWDPDGAPFEFVLNYKRGDPLIRLDAVETEGSQGIGAGGVGKSHWGCIDNVVSVFDVENTGFANGNGSWALGYGPGDSGAVVVGQSLNRSISVGNGYGYAVLRADPGDSLFTGLLPMENAEHLVTSAESADSPVPLNHWELALGTADLADEFAGGFTHDTSNAVITDSSTGAFLRNLRFGEGTYRWDLKYNGDNRYRLHFGADEMQSRSGDQYELLIGTGGGVTLHERGSSGNSYSASASVDTSQVFSVEVDWTPSQGSIDIRVWQASNSRPSTPTLEVSNSYRSEGHVGFYSVQYDGGSQPELHGFEVNAEESGSLDGQTAIIPSRNITGSSSDSTINFEYTVGEDLTPGTYIVGMRCRPSSQAVSNNDGFPVQNTTDGTQVQIDGRGQYYNPDYVDVTSYDYITRVIDLSSDDVGDSFKFSLNVGSQTNVLHHTAVDEVFICPVSMLHSDRRGPQDLVHDAMTEVDVDAVLRTREDYQ